MLKEHARLAHFPHVFVVCVVFQHKHGRDREHHAEEGCRAGAAGRGADHRRATEVCAPALTRELVVLSHVGGRAGAPRTVLSDSPDTVEAPLQQKDVPVLTAAGPR